MWREKQKYAQRPQPHRVLSNVAYGLGSIGDFALNEQSSAKPARVLPRLEQFPGRTSDIIRFGDLDPQGHVNNTVFATFFETGRVMLLREPKNLLNPPGATSVLARLDISFLRETALAGHGRDRHRHGRDRALVLHLPAGDLPRRRMRCDQPRHHGDDRCDNAARAAPAGGGGRAAGGVEITRLAEKRRTGRVAKEASANLFATRHSPSYACRSGIRTTSPSSSSVTLIWQDRREFGLTS